MAIGKGLTDERHSKISNKTVRTAHVPRSNSSSEISQKAYSQQTAMSGPVLIGRRHTCYSAPFCTPNTLLEIDILVALRRPPHHPSPLAPSQLIGALLAASRPPAHGHDILVVRRPICCSAPSSSFGDILKIDILIADQCHPYCSAPPGHSALS